MTIGEKIRFYRKEKSLSQKKLAELADMSEFSIRKYETGKRNPKLEQLLKIATVLEVDVEVLVDLPKNNLSKDFIEVAIRNLLFLQEVAGFDLKYETLEGDEKFKALTITFKDNLYHKRIEEAINYMSKKDENS